MVTMLCRAVLLSTLCWLHYGWRKGGGGVWFVLLVSCRVGLFLSVREREYLKQKTFNFLISVKLVKGHYFIFRTLLKLGLLLGSSNIPLLVCRSYGFIGCMRIVLQEHCGKEQLYKLMAINSTTCSNAFSCPLLILCIWFKHCRRSLQM